MTTVKYIANIDTPTDYIGYLVDGSINVPMDSKNRDYREVQNWIAEGNTPEDAYTQEELDAHVEDMTWQELLNSLDDLTIEFMDHTFSGSQEQQSFVVAMLTKIEGENPNSTRNIYAIDGRTRVPMSKSDMLDFMTEVDIAQEAITDV